MNELNIEKWIWPPAELPLNYNIYYSYNIYCGNCDKRDAIYILKGTKKNSIIDVVCRNCGCSIVKL